MARVAWAPSKISAPLELIVVELPIGQATERQWWEALADRVSEMAAQADPKVFRAVARALGMEVPETPAGAGEAWVLANLNLKTHLNLATDNQVWPAVVEQSEDATEAFKDTDLETWADLAASMVSATDWD